MTQQTAAQSLVESLDAMQKTYAQVAAVLGNVSTLQNRIADLEAQLANREVSPDLAAAVQAVSAQAKRLAEQTPALLPPG